jgi:putative resolvase
MTQKYIKLSEYAKNNSFTYKTAYSHWKLGLIKGKQLDTGTILVLIDELITKKEPIVATYARVSSSENKDNLIKQNNRLISFANAKGYKVFKSVTEVGSGLNDKRPKLYELLKNNDIDIIIIEHKDRLARFGLNYINLLLENNNRKIEIINDVDNNEKDLIQDFVSIITSFTARLYGQRRSKRNTEKLIKELNDN